MKRTTRRELFANAAEAFLSMRRPQSRCDTGRGQGSELALDARIGPEPRKREPSKPWTPPLSLSARFRPFTAKSPGRCWTMGQVACTRRDPHTSVSQTLQAILVDTGPDEARLIGTEARHEPPEGLWPAAVP